MAWPKAEAEQQYVIDIDDVAFSYFVADMLPRLPAPALKAAEDMCVGSVGVAPAATSTAAY